MLSKYQDCFIEVFNKLYVRDMAYRRYYILLFLMVNVSLISGQKLDIELLYGGHSSFLNFHYDSEVRGDKDIDGSGNQLAIALSGALKEKWRFRTELGLMSTHIFVSVDYTVDEGFGPTNTSITSWLSHQFVYLGMLPEYRYTGNKGYLSFYGGGMLINELSKTFTSRNENLQAREQLIGLKLGFAAVLRSGDIGFGFHINYVNMSTVELFNRFHPALDYSFIHGSFGIVYSL